MLDRGVPPINLPVAAARRLLRTTPGCAHRGSNHPRIVIGSGDLPDTEELRLAADGRVTTTPCGDGRLTWRSWGSGPPLVLLHGAHGSWTHWIRNIDALSAVATVVVPDLPGHGDSALPPEPGLGPSHVGTLSDGLRSVLGAGERYALVGFSFGATIAVRLAHHDAASVHSLVLLSLGGFGERAKLRLASVRRLTNEAERDAAHRRNLEILMVADPRTLTNDTVRIQRENVERARVEPRDVAWPSATPAAIHEVGCPVSAIYGERDATIIPNADQRREELLAFRRDADVRIIPGAGHWVQYEAPATVDAIILERVRATRTGQPAG
jgi:pimeloyl-ACP methyl ester carboxylesterase